MLQTMGVTERLIEAAKGGDPVAFEALLETHYDRIYRAAWRATGSREDAQDVAQDVCVKLGAALASFRAEASFTTWLHRIVLNAAADFRRAARAGEHVPLEDESDRLVSTSESAEAGLIRQDLWSAVRALPPQQRDAVLLVYGEDFGHREAGEALGCSEATVSWHLHEARKRLKFVLGATSGASGVGQ